MHPRKKILVVNPNSNPQVTRNLAEALQPVMFDAGPEIECVTLAEGPRLLTNLVDCDLAKIAIDAPAKLVWKPSEGGAPVPFFTLA